MFKRRQAFNFQIITALALLGLIAYLFLPTTSPYTRRRTQPSSAVEADDDWYDNDELYYQAADEQDLNTAKLSIHQAPPSNKVKAAFVILARNSDLQGIRQSIRQLEDRFNRHFNYPYVFLNEENFTNEFKQKTSDLTNAQTLYGKIESDMWGYPPHINQTKAAECRKEMQEKNIIYGGSESYRHMCRFQSGFFFRHPLLDDFEYYWRVEPNVQYFCDIDYDVFQMMKDNDFKYGWTLSLTEYMSTIPTLWSAAQEFMTNFPEYINRGEESLLPWLTDNNYADYNGCHFWSNFEIGSLDFFRSERYLKFFEHLDSKGGFFYERWGDAPVHSLAVAIMLKTSEVHFFNDIGYKHNPLTHCPIEPWAQRKCWCDEKSNFDWTGWSCATRYRKIHEDFAWSESVYRNKTDPYRI
ncbi:MAG: nucleotide-diphospho-sugar transferase [Benjaminiella poitrasii]|nr:MAG: nucleotide-diphospho-sugar transferase [Benjaminiella poitrasii]